MPTRFILLLLAIAAGCGAEDAASSTSGASNTCTGCAPAQGCLQAVVTRISDDSSLPWKYGGGEPGVLDGVGTLVVAATPAGATAVRKTMADADFRRADARQVVDWRASGAVDPATSGRSAPGYCEASWRAGLDPAAPGPV